MTTTRARLVSTALLGSALLVGCLFPSLDPLGANAGRTTDATGTGSKPDSGTSTGTPSATPSTAGTTLPTTPINAGADATPPPPRVPNGVPCRDNHCNAPKYCCANMIADIDDCRDANDDPELVCADQAAGGARAMRCDGPEDCGAGQVCCFVDQASRGAQCAATCTGATLCHETTHCPVGQACTGMLFSEYPICQ